MGPDINSDILARTSAQVITPEEGCIWKPNGKSPSNRAGV